MSTDAFEFGDAEEAVDLWQERFRDALSEGDEEAVAQALRQVNSLDRSAIEALANLFLAGAEDHGAWADVYEHKLVFRPRGRLAASGSLKNTRWSARCEKPPMEQSLPAEPWSDVIPGRVESSAEQRLRKALSKADASAVVEALRETNSLDRSAVDALVYLFDVTIKHHSRWEDLRRHKLVFRRKRRGAPKNLEKHWVRDPQIAALVEQKTEDLRKIAVNDAEIEFGLRRSSIFAAMARKRKRSPTDE